MEQTMVALKGEPEWAREAVKGRKIMAIKIYREVFSCGLKDAKDAVEAYLNRNGDIADRKDWPWMAWLLESPATKEAEREVIEAFCRVGGCDQEHALRAIQSFVHNNFAFQSADKVQEKAKGSATIITSGQITDLRALFQKGR